MLLINNPIKKTERNSSPDRKSEPDGMKEERKISSPSEQENVSRNCETEGVLSSSYEPIMSMDEIKLGEEPRVLCVDD